MTTPAWETQVQLLKQKFPKFKVMKYSDSKLWNWLHQNFFKWAVATTRGYTVYFRDDFFENDRGVEVLKHEAAHMLDYSKWGILYELSYLLLLPAVFTMRAYWEWHGYKETLRSVHDEYAFFKTSDPKYYDYIMDFNCQWVANTFAGSGYLWMFPFKNYMYKKCQDFVKSLS
jgi:hypothetical protein